MSTMTLDLGSARSSTFGAPSTGRRPGFAPLTGTSVRHRRGQSVTEDGFVVPQLPQALGTPLPTGSDRSRSPDRRSITSSPPRNSKRLSGFFGRTSPAATPAELSGALSPDMPVELERMRKELNAMRDQLDETRHELTESNEAKEASEMCVKALREFIAENGVGERQLPAAAQPRAAAAPTAPKQGWGFKLWRADSTASNGSVSSTTPSVTPAAAEASPQPPAAPLTQKIGGFFGARASVASEDGASSRGMHTEEGSDISSADDSVEPLSPASEHPRGAVLVRNPSVASSMGPGQNVGKEGEAPVPSGVALAL